MPQVAKSVASRLARASKKLLLLLATLGVLGIALEIGVRLFTDLPPALGVRDPIVGKRYRPNFQANVFVEEAGRDVFVRFNREGFRGPDASYDRAPDSRRIAVLGDSFVAAIACNEEDTAARRLEDLLGASNPELRWEVLNFGVSGSSTGQELVLYREVVTRYRPDLVVCAYFMGNDFTDNSTRWSSNPRIYFRIEDDELVQVPFSATRRRVSAWLNLHSRFYVWQKRANDILRSRAHEGDRIFSTVSSEALEETWRLNERLILELAGEVRRSGAGFLLVLVPDGAQVYEDRWETVLTEAGNRSGPLDPDYPERRLLAFATAHDIPAVALTEEFRQVAGRRRAEDTRPESRLFFGGDGHFTARGNRIAAGVVHRFLAAGGGRELFDSVIEERAAP